MNNKIFVSQLPWSVCREALKQHFSKYGSINHSYVVVDKVTKRSRGFGFVTFDQSDSVQKAMEAENEMGGRKLVVSFAQEKTENNQQKPTDN
ncbi:RNA-binding region RNP-1 domain-containing protein [Dictyostelium discoideum AX4]|uniref:RNA-binding region RNP-1 domain-containing protein n=1 Tax=Dictyostelium discoideum TaxID=44689 RepID=Q54KH9_DICDI|nr:RNA-binding region RNP-1 domain-containing protein [Dictyostelium discoideum AX4]EAL63735.1 RNA-binding region RNP-1 domain-containing protein [Dictyostelium discoideum AX4]|eukprot:XP_637244.1 RNA-binding region RNP-1 domain-containing protein [Dictyostelium discoideum AX4]